MSIGEKLIDLRGERSQQQVADDLNISVSALSMYENNNRVPRDEIKVRLARYYGVGIEELFYAH